MARDLKLNVDGDAGGGERALEAVAAAADLAAREADRLGKQFKQAQRDAAGLDRQLLETAAAARLLAVELSKNPADKTVKASLDAEKKRAAELKSLSKDVIGDTQKAAKEAERFAVATAKDLAKLKKAADDAGLSFAQLPELLGKLPELLGPAAPFAIAGAATVALANVGGAVGAGAGALGVGAGIGGAIAGNPDEFKAAWADAIGGIKAEWIDASRPFTDETLTALRSVGPIVSGWGIDKTLAAAAKYEKPLVDGITKFVTGVEHGVASLIQNAGPEVAALSKGLGQLGDAADKALTDISDGAEGGAAAIGDTLAAVSLLVEGFGKVTEAAENAYDFIANHPIAAAVATGGASAGASFISWVFGSGNTVSKLTDVHAASEGAAAGLNDIAAAAADAHNRLDDLNQSFDDSISKALGLKGANVDVAQGLADVAANFRKTHDALSLNTEAGRENQQLILGVIGTLEQQREAAIAAGDGTLEATHKADDAYNQNLAKLDQILAKLLGSKTAAENFLNAFKNTDFTITEHFRVVTTGPVSSQGVVTGGVPRRAQGEVGFAHGGIRAAQGLIVGPSNPGSVLFGEPQTGGEVLIPRRGIDAGRAADLGRAALGGYGLDVVARQPRIPAGLFDRGSAGPPVVNFSLTGSASDFDRFMAGWFMKAQRTGAVQVTVR